MTRPVTAADVRSQVQQGPDLCQATATPPALKYENEGGPGIRKILDLLLRSQEPAEDRRDFLRTLVVFRLLAAIDGHARHFSLLLLRGGAYRLTPRYDVRPICFCLDDADN